MPQYAYRARDRRGTVVSGVLAAPTEEDLSQQLRVRGMMVLEIAMRSARGRGLGALGNIHVLRPRVKLADLVYFANQLSVMVDTGVPLPEALEAIVQQTTNPTFREVLAEVADDVESGMPFSEALEKHPKHFNNMFVSLVRAGETTGNLGRMLTDVATYLSDSQETRRRVYGALAYPAFMACLAVVVLTVLLTFVLPKFTKIYENKGALLPAPTRVLLGLSQLLTHHWIVILVAVVALVVGAVFFFRRPVGQRFADALKIRFPVMGRVAVKYYTARSFRALGTMIDAGVPVITALEIARRTARNSYFREVFDEALGRVSEGEMLSDQFFRTDLVPVTTAQMIFAGEKAGRLGEVLLKVSHFCDQDLKGALKQMSTLLEPLLIGLMGLLVGGIAISLLLPMFTISKVITK